MNRNFDPTVDADFEPRVADWLEADPAFAPGGTLDTVLAAVPSIPQRRALRVPWRLPPMFTPARVVLVAALGVALVSGALLFTHRPAQPTVGTEPTAAPSSSPTQPASTAPSGPPLGLAIVDLDGTVRQDLGMPLDAWGADLSADGRVAFLTASEELGPCGGCGSSYRIAILEPDGTTSYVLGPEGPDIRDLAWSPDGSQLAYADADESGNTDIYVLEVNPAGGGSPGGTVRRLTTDPAIDEFPAWTPDGAAIIYDNMGATEPDGSGFSPTQEIWSAPTDGGAPTQLTSND